jgi:hypothetical protein
MIGCVKSELSLFDPLAFQTTMEKAMWIDYHALSNLDSTGPIEFHITGTTEEYIDVNDTMLYIKAKIVQPNGENLQEDAEVAFTNMPLSSLFADVQLFLNEHQVEGGNQLYPYRAMISTLIQNGEACKKNQLITSGFVKENPGLFNDRVNDSYVSRKAWTAESDSREFCGPLHLDFFQQSKYLLGKVDIRLKLVRAQAEFALMKLPADNGVAPRAKIMIEDAVLYVRKVRVAASVINGHEAGLQRQNVIYPLQRCEVVSYTIPHGSLHYDKDNLFRSQMPKLVIFGLVSNAAFSGAYNLNPFNFHHFNVNYIALHREGESIPHRPFKPDFPAGLYMREFMALFQAMQYYNRDDDCGIGPEDFAGGTTLYAFNLAADLCISGHAQPLREGNLRLEMNFAEATQGLINIIIWALFDSKIEITRLRDVLLDYKS